MPSPPLGVPIGCACHTQKTQDLSRQALAASHGSSAAAVGEGPADALNRRIRRYQQSTSPNWNVSEFYYNSDWQLVDVRSETKTRSGDPPAEPALATTLKEQYVWSVRYIDSPVLRDRDADGNSENGLEERLYYLTDANYNVTALVDASGAVQVRYVYDPYGVPTCLKADWSSATWAESKANKILFQGMYYDIETGLYHVRHRMYHPTLGRWLQRDPLGYVDGMGLYEMEGGSPTVMVDPWGLEESKVSWPPRAQELARQLGLPLPCGSITINSVTLTNLNVSIEAIYKDAGTLQSIGRWAKKSLLNAALTFLTGKLKEQAAAAAGTKATLGCPGDQTCCIVWEKKGVNLKGFSIRNLKVPVQPAVGGTVPVPSAGAAYNAVISVDFDVNIDEEIGYCP